MVQKKNPTTCSPAGGMGTCRVESLVTIDDRGQMVLPKDIREKAGIKAGDKLAVVSWEKEGNVCCISLIRADELMGMVRELLGPMIGEGRADDVGEQSRRDTR